MTIAIPVIAANGAKSTITVADPVVSGGAARGLITAFNPASDNWQTPNDFVLDGQQWFKENANKAWSLTKIDNYTVRMEVRPGDLWADDGTSRSEILTVKNTPYGAVFKASWTMLVEAGVPGTMAWRSTVQVHDGDVPIVSLSIINDIMNVLVNQTQGPSTQPYLDTAPIQRGHPYTMSLEMKKASDSTGYLKMWRDGVQIVNYTGPIGINSNTAYIKFGVYQGWPENVSSPLAIRYGNIALDFQPPPPPPPLPSGLNNVGETSITTTDDSGNAGLICAQKVTLTTAGQLKSLSIYIATAAGNLRMGLYGANGNNPGSKIIDAGQIALSGGAGWKTINVTNGPMLQPGDYWPYFEVSSNSAHYRTGGGGSIRCASAAFGPAPTTFPAISYTNDSTHWSMYMTVNVP